MQAGASSGAGKGAGGSGGEGEGDWQLQPEVVRLPTRLNSTPQSKEARQFFYTEAAEATLRAINGGLTRVSLRCALPVSACMHMSPSCVANVANGASGAMLCPHMATCASILRAL